MIEVLAARSSSGSISLQERRWLLASGIVGLILVGVYVARSGTWLDDYWQLWISGAPNQLLFSRLLGDQHPPWFNLFGRLVVAITNGNILYARIVNLVAAALALALGLRKIGGLEAGLRYRIFLMVIASAGLIGMADLAATFRVYPWLLVLASLQGAILLAVAGHRRVEGTILVLVTTVSIALHYAHAIGAIAIAAVTVFIAWLQKDLKTALVLAAAAMAGMALDVGTALLQSPHWRSNFDVNWVASRDDHPWNLLGQLLANSLLFNVVAAILIVTAMLRGEGKRVLLVLAPLPVALCLWLAIDIVRPILVPRYLASAGALFSVAGATAFTELRFRSAANAAIAAVTALQPLFYGLLVPPRAGLEEGARIARTLTQTCPQSPLFAIPAWRFRDQPDSRTAHYETPVMGLSYTEVARRFGLKPKVVTRPLQLIMGICPAIVWIEGAHGIERVPVTVVLRRAQLIVSGPFAAKFLRTQNGAVLLISQPDRLGRSQ